MTTNTWTVEYDDGTTTTIEADEFELFCGSYRFFTGPGGVNPKLQGRQVCDIPAGTVKSVKLTSGATAETPGSDEPSRSAKAWVIAAVIAASTLLVLRTLNGE